MKRREEPINLITARCNSGRIGRTTVLVALMTFSRKNQPRKWITVAFHDLVSAFEGVAGQELPPHPISSLARRAWAASGVSCAALPAATMITAATTGCRRPPAHRLGLRFPCRAFPADLSLAVGWRGLHLFPGQMFCGCLLVEARTVARLRSGSPLRRRRLGARSGTETRPGSFDQGAT